MSSSISKQYPSCRRRARGGGQGHRIGESRLTRKTVDFDSFTRVLNRPGGFRDPGEPEEYCRGFQVFDKDLTGFIGVGQFRYILTNLGEKMSDDEVDELLKAVDTSSGELNYMGEFDIRLVMGMRS